MAAPRGAKKRLEHRLVVLVERLARVGIVQELPRGVDEVDLVLAHEEQELVHTSRFLLIHAYREHAAALERLDVGAYGVCIECEGDIPPARLAALPEAARCVPCQAALEVRDRRTGGNRWDDEDE